MRCIAPECGQAAQLGAVFCAPHLRAPDGQRGGWISAERRRRARAAHSEVSPARLDASNIARRLWVGAVPPFDRHLPEFDVLVLCAQEHQPERLGFRGLVVRCPLPDSALSINETNRALGAGKDVARALTTGKRVLVTCAMGINRSALVAGLGLGLATTKTADEIIKLIQHRRNPKCLYNTHFQQMLHRFIGRGAGRAPAPGDGVG